MPQRYENALNVIPETPKALSGIVQNSTRYLLRSRISAEALSGMTKKRRACTSAKLAPKYGN